MANGTYSIKFSIYDTAAGGNRLWTATGTTATPIALSVTVQNGLFTILLGDNSTGTSQQNALDNTINWNSDNLYLGVTIGADAEMTPRKRLSSAPYAFNADRLQGMYASSSVFATSSLFVINQTSNTAATGTRSALEIRSSGTSTPYDFLLRGVNDQSDAVFTVNRLGSVTTTGNFALGDGTSDLITVNGRFNADLVPATDLAYSFGTASLRWNAILGNVTSSAVTTTSAYVSGTASTTLLFANGATFGTSTIAGKGVCLSDGSFCSSGAGSDTLATVTDRGSSATATLQLYGGFLASSSTVTSTFTVVGGTNLQNTTATYLAITNTLTSTYPTGTTLYTATSVTIAEDVNPGKIAVFGRQAYVLNSGTSGSFWGINIWDVTNPIAPTTTVSSTLTIMDDFVIDGRYVYMNDGISLYIYDHEAGANVKTIDLPLGGGDMVIHGGTLFIGNDVWDVHDPQNPTQIATLSGISGSVTELAAQGKYLYLLDTTGSSNLNVYDISDSLRPRLVSSMSFGFGPAPSKITVQDSYAYVADGSTVYVVSIANPSAPFVVRSLKPTSGFSSISKMKVSGRYLYLLQGGAFYVVDIQDIDAIGTVATLSTTGYADFDVSGRYAYLVYSGVTDTFDVADLGGAELNHLQSALAEFGSLQVRRDGRIENEFFVGGALNVGAGGIQVDGGLKVNATNTTSSVAGSIVFEKNAIVGSSTYAGQLNSLFVMDGNDLFTLGNIGSASSIYTNGAFIAGTGTTMFGDGFIRRTNGVLTISATGGLSLGGSVTSTGQFYGNMVTSTSLFANTAVFGGAVVSGSTVCLSSGVGCTGGAEADTLATVSARGASATATLLLYGGFLASSSTVTSTFTVVGGTSLQGTTFASATGTSFSLTGRVNSNLLPQTDLGYSLGSVSLRWNAYLGSVTATAVTTTNLFAATASTTNLYASTSSIVNLNTQNLYGVNATFTNLYFPGALVGSYVSGSTLAVRSSVTIPGNENPTRIVVSDRHAYVLNQAPEEGVNSIRVWDVSDPGSPTTSVTTTSIGLEDLAVDGRYLYVDGGASGLRVYDVTSPDRPTTVGTYPDSVGTRIHVYGGYAYLKGGIFDVHNPQQPRLVATLTGILGSIVDTYLQGKIYYVLESSGSPSIKAFDVSDPTRPVLISETAFPGFSPSYIVVQGGYAYITDSDSIRVFDIGDLNAVYQVGTLGGFSSISQIQVVGRYVFMLDGSGFKIIDVLDPDSPGIVATNATGFTHFDVSGRYVYLVTSGITDSFTVIDLGGVDISNLMAGAAELGKLQVRTDGRIARNLDVGGSLTVGPGGLFVDGPFMVNASNTTSSIAGSIAFEQNATVGTSTYTDQLHSLFAMSGDDLFVAGNIGSVSSVYTNGAFMAGTGTTMMGDGFIRRTNGVLTVSASGGVSIGGSVTSTGTFSAGTVTSTSLFGNMATLGGLVVSGTTVCLTSGVGCAAAGGTDLNWTYSGASNGFVYNATATIDIILGNTATATASGGAPAYFDLSGGTIGTSSIYFGFNTNTNVFIGTSTQLGLHSLFSLSGNDLVVGGNIGSASSIYTNGAFVAGTGTTMFGDGFITVAAGSELKINGNVENIVSADYQPLRVATTTFVTGADPQDVFVSGRYAYVANTGNDTLATIDISNPTSLVQIATTTLTSGADPVSVFVSGRYAYVTDGITDALLTIDISNPASPVQVATTTLTPGVDPQDVFVSGRYAYVANGNGNTLATIDISNPVAPVQVATTRFKGGSFPISVFVSGRYAYVANADGDTLATIDISNPAAPVQVATTTFAATQQPISVFVSGRYAYVSNGSGNTLATIDISNATAPVQVATTTIAGGAGLRNIFVSGRYVYVANYGNDTLATIDISTPAAPVQVATTTFTGGFGLRSVFVSGRYAYVVNNASNFMNTVDIGGTEVNGLIAHSAEVGSLQVLTNGTVANQLTVGGGLTVGNNGILSQGPLAVSATNTTSSFAGMLTVGTTTLGVAMHSLFSMNGDDLFVAGNIGSASSIYTNGAFIAGTGTTMFGSGFISNNSATLTILSVSSTQFIGDIYNLYTTSSKLTLMSSISIGSAIRPRIEVQGDFAYTASSNTLRVIDLHDPSNPSSSQVRVGTSTTELTRVLVSGRYAYAFDRDAGAMYVVDILNPNSATVVSTSTGLYVYDAVLYGTKIFAATDSSSYTTIDISDPLSISFGFFSPGYSTNKVAMGNNILYGFGRAPAYIQPINIQDPITPTGYALYSAPFTSTLSTSEADNSSLEVDNNYVYVLRPGSTTNVSSTLDIFRFDANFTAVTSVRVSGFVATSTGLTIKGRYAYVVGSDQNLHVYDVNNPASPAEIFVANLGNNAAYDIEIMGRYLLVVNDGDNTMNVYRLPGIEAPSLYSSSAELGSLYVRDMGRVNGQLLVDGAIAVGSGGILSTGSISAQANSIFVASKFINKYNTLTDRAWGAYINRLLVGNSSFATGTQDFNMLIAYDSASTTGGASGLCLDNLNTAPKCPTTDGSSILADDAITGSNFDIAEVYSIAGSSTPGELIIIDTSTSVQVRVSDDTPYDPRLVGVVSTDPAFVMGWNEGTKVALKGRVPTKVSVVNGAIRIGDPLTSSIYPGVAMKATKPGMIVGYALDDADTTSTIEVFVDVGYNANGTLATDGTVSTFNDDLVFVSTSTASSTNPTVDSFGLTFRGSAYNTSTSQVSMPSFTLMTDVQSAVSSVFAFRNASGTNVASLTEQGDLSIAGRLFLSARGTPQDQFYMYLDDSLAPTSTYVATNANGFQANSSYDLAERYYSPDNLEPGDLVMIRPEGQIHVQRTSGEDHVVIGIVSTQPGFVLGAHTTSSYPIALAGRVPTNVSTMNGAIKAGDAVGPSSIPGVAVKATSGGPIVGYALEAYDAPDVGKVEVFLSAQAALASSEGESPQPAVLGASTSDAAPGGFAVIQSGATRVHVSYASIGAYPKVFVTPATEAGNWWTENYTDVGFDIVLSSVLPRDVMFGWEVRPLMAGSQLFSSDNTYQALDPLTGQIIPAAEGDPAVTGGEEDAPIDETAVEDTGSTSSTEPTT